jgi:ABC-type glycerol-3-phosphate transport system substrate-binding protein
MGAEGRIFVVSMVLLVVVVSGLRAAAEQERTVVVWAWMNPPGAAPRELPLRQILDNYAQKYPHEHTRGLDSVSSAPAGP